MHLKLIKHQMNQIRQILSNFINVQEFIVFNKYLLPKNFHLLGDICDTYMVHVSSSDLNGEGASAIIGTHWDILSIEITRKYPLRGYILGLLTHAIPWDQNLGGDETLE